MIITLHYFRLPNLMIPWGFPLQHNGSPDGGFDCCFPYLAFPFIKGHDMNWQTAGHPHYPVILRNHPGSLAPSFHRNKKYHGKKKQTLPERSLAQKSPAAHHLHGASTHELLFEGLRPSTTTAVILRFILYISISKIPGKGRQGFVGFCRGVMG